MEKTAYERMKSLEGEHWWFVARREIIELVIGSCRNKIHNKILEVGCGTGGNFSFLSQFGDIVGIEPSSLAVSLSKENAKKHKILNLTLEELTPEVIADDYDFILLLDVLEHIEDPELALQKINQISQTKAKIIITVPAYQFLWGPHDVEHKHHRRYTRKSLAQSLRNQGFEIEKISYMNTLLFPVVLVARLINRLFNKTMIKDSRMPSPFVNSILKRIFGFEKNLLKRFNLPFGCSLICVCKINDKKSNF